MRLIDGRYLCDLCGAVVDVRPGAAPFVVIVAASGQPNMRTIHVDGVEVHRCPFPRDAP